MRVGRCVVAVCIGLSCCAGASGQSTGPVTTLIEELSNNTSACSSSTDPGGNQPYCFAFFNGFGTNSTDIGVETATPDSPAGHVSSVSMKQLLPSGWAGKILCEYQPWFGASNHKSIGYSQNSAATVAAQDSFMLAVGCDVNLIDFYGALDPAQSFNLASTNAVFADLSARAGFPLKFGIMEDKNALTSTCAAGSTNESATVTCLENALIQEMDYVNTHYASSGAYFTDNGNPVIFSFVTQETWPVLTSADWATIWSALKAHTDSYSAPFKYIFEYGSFSSASYDNGRYAWMQPPKYSSTQQFWWGSVTSLSPSYLESFYSAALAHPSQIAVAGLWKGFDDNNASWSGNRIIAQQCGQVLLQTANEITKYISAGLAVPYVQVATWNDYEEGTEIETGIDNCYTVNATLSGSQLTWSLAASDSYASLATVHHFIVFYADATGSLYAAVTDLPATTTSLDLSSIVPPGNWTMYVEMVGQPMIINRMSNGVPFTRAVTSASLSPTTVAFGNQTLGTSSAMSSVILLNTGTTVLSVYGVSTVGDFSQTNNCPASLAAGSACTISITFSPSVAGSRSGTLQVNDSTGSAAQMVALTGMGTQPGVSLSAATLSFPSQAIGTSSASQPVTVSNSGTGMLTIAGISATGDFSLVANGCSGNVNPSASCAFNVAFTPSAVGPRSGSVTILSNASGSTSIVLSGNGSDYSVTASPNAQSVSAGSSAAFAVAVPSAGAPFPGTISLSCKGLPANADCTFSSNSQHADASATLTLATASVQTIARRDRNPTFIVYASLLPSSGIGLLGVVFAAVPRRRRRQLKFMSLGWLLMLVVGLTACGGGILKSANNVQSIPGTGTPAGTYKVMIVASSGALSHSTNITLTVQ